MSTNTIAIILLIILFLGLIVLGVRIGYAMIAASVVVMLYLKIPLVTVLSSFIGGVEGFSFLAIPFFIIAGDLMSEGGISDRLVMLADASVGWMRGGLAMVNVLDSMFFGGISGSATADVASLGTIVIPMMTKSGYDVGFSTAITMSSAIQGLLIPPSHNMIIYSLSAGGVSVGGLFLAGIIPGVFLGITLMIYCYIVSVKRNYPKGEPFSIKRLLRTIKESIWSFGAILIIMAGVATGIFTATEASVVAVVYAFIITFFVYKERKVSEFWGMLGNSIKTLSTIFLIIAAAGSLGFVVAYLKIPVLFADFILSLTTNKYLIMAFVLLLLLILGTMMGMASIIIITTPILLPIVMQLGYSPIHFGVIMILACGIGLITPPVGAVLFIGSSISGESIENLTVAMLPFYVVMVIVLLIITYVPGISMFLPNLLM